jgi:mannose-6-phosphate isomerase-like protein (cupin superfamily)
MEQPITPTVFKYTKPETEKNKTFIKLAWTNRIFANVQILKRGGENDMHSHQSLDGFWMVLKGRARFYGKDDSEHGEKIIAELGPMEGILIPRNFFYWFEAVEGEDLELLQVEASHKNMADTAAILEDRVSVSGLTDASRSVIEQLTDR